MYRLHVSPQTQNKRTSSLICGAKRRTGARIATFGLSVLVAGQLMLPGAALAAEMPETVAGQDAAATAVADPAAPVIAKQAAEAPAATADVAASSVMDAEPAAPAAAVTESAPAAAQDTAETEAAIAPAGDSTAALAPKSVDVPSAPAAALTRGTANPGGGEIKINTTVVNHFYDLELPPAFTLIQDEAYVYDFPDAPEDFTLWHNESVYFFKIDSDTEALVKTDTPKEANVSISLAAIDNHERATLVFTGGGADPLISCSLDLLHLICIGALADFDFSNYNNGEGTILETRHEYFIRFGSNVYLIATDTTDPEPDPGAKPDPDVKPDPETETELALQPEAQNPAANPVSAKTAAIVEPAKTALPATGDSDAVAAALGAAGAAAAAAVAGVAAARRCNR